MESRPQEQTAREGRSRSTAASPSDVEQDLTGFGLPDAANDTRMSQLARTIEEEIIPRLMLAHRTATEALNRPRGPRHAIAVADVHHFAKLVLSVDEDVAFTAVQSFRARGVPVEKIYLDLLAPTARYLGELWDEDLCTFTDVTVGLGRLQRVLRELSPALGGSVGHPTDGRRVLLLPSPGESHTFGLVMVGEFFRKAGWDVTGGAWADDADPASLVGGEWFDALGFSLGAEVNMPALADTIEAVRHASCNRDLAVLVGGALFDIHPEWVEKVGADGMTIDARAAPALAETLIAGKARKKAIC